MSREAILKGEEREEDKAIISLRPGKLAEFIGQEKLKSQLQMYMDAARVRGDVLDHLLLHGPPGLGKTTLAQIVSNEMGVNLKISSGPAIERPGDLAALLTNLSQGDVLFIDEIHRLKRNVEELLYPAMEDFKLDLIIGEGPHAQAIRLDLPKFTLVGATTRTGLLTNPLRDRFEVVFHLDFYTDIELKEIVLRGGKILGITASEEGAAEIAKRARGTPRIANRLLKRVRDFAQVKKKSEIDQHVAKEALDILEVDEEGFDELDRRILLTIIDKFDGGPVGLETLSAALSEEKDTISEVYEPYLLKKGFLQRTPQGRTATEQAYRHLGLLRKKSHEERLI
jgi:Holliday junction DNA helicase RuvB